MDRIIPQSEYYDTDTYNHRDRWIAYFHQVRLVRKYVKSGSVLEVGIGNGIVASTLRRSYNVITVDIEQGLHPDHVASVDDLQGIASDSIDVALCAEVLEHLPFDRFAQCIRELKRVSKHYVIIALPYWGYTLGMKVRLPVLGTHTLKLKITGIKHHRFNGQHYWEVGKIGYPVSKISKKIAAEGLEIIENFWDLDDPYHRYFVCKK